MKLSFTSFLENLNGTLKKKHLFWPFVAGPCWRAETPSLLRRKFNFIIVVKHLDASDLLL